MLANGFSDVRSGVPFSVQRCSAVKAVGELSLHE